MILSLQDWCKFQVQTDKDNPGNCLIAALIVYTFATATLANFNFLLTFKIL